MDKWLNKVKVMVIYRKLNKITKKEIYFQLSIVDALEILAGSTFFSTLDLRSNYCHVAVHPKD